MGNPDHGLVIRAGTQCQATHGGEADQLQDGCDIGVDHGLRVLSQEFEVVLELLGERVKQ